MSWVEVHGDGGRWMHGLIIPQIFLVEAFLLNIIFFSFDQNGMFYQNESR